MEKHVHFASPPPDLSKSEFVFQAGGTVQKPNHMTRYVYPSLCGYPKGCIRLQPPANSTKRSRPQGSGSWGIDGHTFLSISNTSIRVNHDQVAFDSWSAVNLKADEESGHALAHAMARMSKYQGNTLLEAGKFQLKKDADMVYVIKRTSVLLLPRGPAGEERFGREEVSYKIDCRKWREAMPVINMAKGHDHWWTRLHSLFQASSDRAFFHARDQQDNVIDLPPPLVKWYPRPDIEGLVTVHTDKTPPSFEQARYMGDACPVCSRTWFTQNEHACRLQCGHFLCLECLTQHVDSNSGTGNLRPNETDPDTKFFRCIECKSITPLLADRTTITQPDEVYWWTWRICMRRLEKETQNWLVNLHALAQDGWAPEIPEGWDTDRQINEVRTRVRYDHAVNFMAVPRQVWKVLPYGFTLDNPAVSPEALALEEGLQAELKRLSENRTMFNTKEIIDHMAEVGKAVLKPVVVQDEGMRLRNPVTPPGYEAYRDFLCEWTARGVLMSPTARVPLFQFMYKMVRNKGLVWWKNERDVGFDR